MVLDQPAGRRGKIVEDILLVLEHSRPVPILPVLSAAAQAGERVEAPHFDPCEIANGKQRRLRYVKTAIAVQESRRLTGGDKPLPRDRNIGIFVPSFDG